jgi:hypothetical protein
LKGAFMKKKSLLCIHKLKLCSLSFSLFALLLFSVIFSPASALATNVTLYWDPVPLATGYKLHYGFESSAYVHVIDVGPNLQHTLSDLDENQMYYSAVSAYNESEESGYSEEISFMPVGNQPPIADAGPDQTVNEFDSVTLNGSNSLDPDDGIASFYWEQLEGTGVNLSNPGQEIIAFTAPDIVLTGEALVFRLTAKDYSGLVASDTCVVNVSAVNSPPKADAGPDQTVSEGAVVTLDASNSSDQDDGIQSYRWSQIAGTAVQLSASDSIKTSFVSHDVGPEGESLKFQLTAIDNGGLQSNDECIVNVTWVNLPPTADAGPDQIVQGGDMVTLDGSGSKDIDDGISTVMWSQTSGPPVELSSSAVYQPSFTAPEAGSESIYLAFDLTIIDGGNLQAQDSCVVEVAPAPVITADSVEIVEAVYDARKQKLSVKAKSSGSAKSVVLSAWADEGSKEVELGQLRYDKRSKLHTNTFRKIKSKPLKITVKSTGGGTATLY